MLAEHPKVLERLRKEVLDVVGESSRPTYDDIKEMKYLRAVINGRRFPLLFLFQIQTQGNRDAQIVSCCVSLYQLVPVSRWLTKKIHSPFNLR